MDLKLSGAYRPPQKVIWRGLQKKSIQERNEMFNTMALVAIKNEFVQFCCCIISFTYLLPPSHLDKNEGGMLWSLFWTLVFFLPYDFIFFTGHYFLHNPTLHRFHRLHHSTYADSAVSGHYMHWIDWWLESILPGLVGSLILCYWFGAPGSAFVNFTFIGGFNTAVVHSGWEFDYLPSPWDHYAHHKKLNRNYAIGPSDLLNGSWEGSTEVKLEELKHNRT